MRRKIKIKEGQKIQLVEDQDHEQLVIEYLRTHRDFFIYHTDLLGDLTIPHLSGEAISLVERQLALLHHKNRVLKQQLQNLIENAKINGDLSKKIHQLTLRVFTMATPQAMLETLFSSLRADFEVNTIALWLFANEQFPDSLRLNHPNITLIPKSIPELKIFTHILKSTQPICGRLTMKQKKYLFREQADIAVSCVLIPFGERQRIGMLAMGSQEPDRFQPELGTMFLSYLGAVIERILCHRRSA